MGIKLYRLPSMQWQMRSDHDQRGAGLFRMPDRALHLALHTQPSLQVCGRAWGLAGSLNFNAACSKTQWNPDLTE